jgi:hypothetical protein
MALAEPIMAESKETSATETASEDLKSEEMTEPKKAVQKKTGVEAPSKDKILVTTEKTPSGKEHDEENIEYAHGLKLAVILSALCLAVFLVALDQTIIATAIPKITDHFQSIRDIGWYGSAYLLTATALQPTFGRVYTIFSVSDFER